MKKFHRRTDEKGAALVEFAIVAMLLITLLLGIVEFGWYFSQFNALRHGAREGSRYASVNGGVADTATAADIAGVVCQAVTADSAGMTQLVVTVNNGGGAVGSDATITVVADVNGITGFFSSVVSQLSSGATFRMEKAASWTGGSTTFADPATCA